MTPLDTGSPREDAASAFQRERRRQTFESLVKRLRREPSDVDIILPYEEVIDALGYAGERFVGLETIELDTIVGTVGRRKEFDRRFRPTTTKTRERWTRIAQASKKGESFPPIDVYRIGEAHFVKDGHHRVSVARALGHSHIEARVTEVRTKVGADRRIRMSDLPVKEHERLFRERVPLERKAYKQLKFRDPMRYSELAEAVEAWGFRLMQEADEFYGRHEVAQRWFNDEFCPVVEVLKESGLLGERTEAEAYVDVACERWRLLRTHSWSEEVWERLTRERRR